MVITQPAYIGRTANGIYYKTFQRIMKCDGNICEDFYASLTPQPQQIEKVMQIEKTIHKQIFEYGEKVMEAPLSIYEEQPVEGPQVEVREQVSRVPIPSSNMRTSLSRRQ